MDVFLLLILAGVVFAFRSAYRDIRKALGESTAARVQKADPSGSLPAERRKGIARRHKVAWWLREAAQGFPHATAGWSTGWHAHKAAASQLAEQAAKAKADGLEHALTARELIRQHRQRAQAAKAAARAAQPVPATDGTDPQPAQPQPAADAEPVPAAGPDPSPAPGIRAVSGEPSPNGRTEPVANSQTLDAPEITYDQLMKELTKEVHKTEVAIAELRLEQLKEAADQLTGALRDSKTVGNLANTSDATKEAIKALEARLEALHATKDGLRHDHGGMHEAHQTAPVPGAHPGFYEGS